MRSVARHRRTWSAGRVAVVVVAAAAMIATAVVAATAGWGREGCGQAGITVTVAAAPDHYPVVSQLAEEWHADRPTVAGRCAEADVVAMPSHFAAATLGPAWDPQRDGPAPDVWLPESSLWLRVAQARPGAAHLFPSVSPSLALSPVVLAAQRAMAEALGWPERELGLVDLVAEFRGGATWERYDRPEWGPVRLALPDPAHSTAGMAAVLTVLDPDGDQLASDEELLAAAAFARLVGEETADGEALLRRYDAADAAVAVDLPAAFPILERDLARHPTRGAELVAVYPREGVIVADYPAVLLEGPRSDEPRREAAETFLAYLRGPNGRRAYLDAGFRDPTGAAGRGLALPGSRGFRSQLPARRTAAPSATPDLLAAWESLNRPHRVVVVLDTSGSMADPVPETDLTRLELLQQAAAEGVGLLTDQTWVGLWEFSTRLTPTTPYRELVPVGPAGTALPGGTVRRQAMLEAIDGLRANGGTGLYDTVYDAYRMMGADWQADAQNLVVVITDGRDEDHLGRSRGELLADLGELVSEDQPLPVIALAIGPEADVAALEAIVAVTGGRVFVARDEVSAIEQVALAFAGRIR